MATSTQDGNARPCVLATKSGRSQLWRERCDSSSRGSPGRISAILIKVSEILCSAEINIDTDINIYGPLLPVLLRNQAPRSTMTCHVL